MASETLRVADSCSTGAASGPVSTRGVYRHYVLRGVDYLGGFALAIVWLRSGAAHLANPYYFLFSIYQYQLVGPATGRVLAMTLPFIQLVIAVCLIGRVFVGGALLVSGILFGLFAAAQIWASVNELGISCGCFGTSSSPIGIASISTALILFLLATACCVCHVALERVAQTRKGRPLRSPTDH